MSALSDRDMNAQSQSNPFETKKSDAQGEENLLQQSHQHKNVLANKPGDHNSSGTYISPSDAIMSPASQKLSSFKQRQINKQNRSDPARRSLFARTVSANSEKTFKASSNPSNQAS